MCLVYVSTSTLAKFVISGHSRGLGRRKSIRSKGGWADEKTRLRVDFRMWWLNPFTIASPMSCAVVIEGVGAVWECPKNWRSCWEVVLAFQW